MMSAAAPFLRRAHIKRVPEDFEVTEDLDLAWTGAGEHAYFFVEKIGRNTTDVADELARAFGVAPRDVGYAGRKDKHAVTRQWFSAATAYDQWPDIAGTRCLEVRRHERKLRRGTHSGNRFRIRLRDVQGCSADELRQLSAGFPNRFGWQRVSQDNVDRARRWLARPRRQRDPKYRGWSLSVLRARLFNAVLDERIVRGALHTVLEGDALDAAGVVTGPLWGRGRSTTRGAALEIEQAALEPWQEVCEGLEYAGLTQARRRLVERPLHLAVDASRPTEWLLQFELPPGAYATSMLQSVLPIVDDSRLHGEV